MASSHSIAEKHSPLPADDEKAPRPQASSTSRISLDQTLGSDTENSPSSDEADCSSTVLSKYETSWIRRVLTPKNCRWDPKHPKPLTLAHCILYAMASAFTVSNLYYNQPILNRLALDFHVSYEVSSQVATLMQSGYAAGLIFVLPLGDILERRPFIISLILVTATLWIGLCVTKDFTTFRALSFICGLTTVTPQLMIPLVGDFAPAHRKSSLLSIVVSGLMLGILIARLLSGVVTNFTSWRNIYWVACGAQYLLASLLIFFMPDYPSTNPDGLNYFRALWSIPYMMLTEPVLIQACLITFTLSCIFTSFWTTLTFLLASSPFDYSSLQIGLFSLTGLVTILAIPLIGRLIDRWVPLLSTLAGQFLALTGTIVGTFTGTFTIGGPIVQAIGIDIGVQTAQVANRAAIFNINPRARNRVNTAYMACAFVGQLTGTAVGNKLYAHGGWKHSGACSIGFVGASILFALIRGPRETGWFGWKGGWSPRRDSPSNPAQSSPEAGVQTNANAYSGVAYALAPSTDAPIDLVSGFKSYNSMNTDKEKAPSVISYQLKEDGSIPRGYDVSPDLVSIRWFKLLLIDDKDIPSFLKTSSFLNATKTLMKEEGKSCVEVIKNYLHELWELTLDNIKQTHGDQLLQNSAMHIVATVPAIWPHYARLRMKSAIAAADMFKRRGGSIPSLSFISEPEAAAIASLQDLRIRRDLKAGDHVVICDAGGGTDIITYTVASLDPFIVRESVKGDGKLCGGAILDNAFTQLLRDRIPPKIFGDLGYAGIRKVLDSQWEDWVKESFCKDSKRWDIKIPPAGPKGDQSADFDVPVTREEVVALHEPIVEEIIGLVNSQVDEVQAKYDKAPRFVILVGGFGKSRHLYDCIQESMGKRVEVLQARGERPWTAISRGVVIRGLLTHQSPTSSTVLIDGRISRASYGTLFNEIPFTAGVHDLADRFYCEVSEAFLAESQTKWFIEILRESKILAEKPIKCFYYQDLENPDDLVTATIVYSESPKPPARKNSSVKTLCQVEFSNVPNWGRLPRYQRTDGGEVRRFEYELRMLSDGSSLDFSIYYKGKQLGCQNVAVKFSDADEKET